MAGQSINYELSVETFLAAQFAQFVADHPEVVGIKFWHGQTALHKISLRQDSTEEILRILIAAGADVNAVNNYGETPLMFSAKRGSVPFCELLMENGADLTVCDKAGRQIIHHATMGGSIYLVHYLRIVYSCNLDSEDNRKQTPLHISTSQGNLAMVDYLLQAGLVDMKRADAFGNTALHHAAIYGHEQVVHSLLHHAGLSILDIRNEKGQTPIEVMTGNGSKHMSTNKLLQYAHLQKSAGNTTLQHPRGLLFWYLIMPAVFFAVGLTGAELLQIFIGWYSGVMCMSVVMTYIVYLFMVHSHRIKHHSRLPNPMPAGAFGAGLIGTFITWTVAVLPKLNIAGDQLNIIVCGLVLLLLPPTFYFYWLLLVSDPGYVPLPNKELPNSTASKVTMRSVDSIKRFCVQCSTMYSGNVKHCKLCERCVVHMDHHCLFLMKCVATSNHRLFNVFIIIVNINIDLFLISTCRYFYHLYNDLQTADIFSKMVTEHIMLFFVILLNVFSNIWGWILVHWQLRLISQGYTYYETISHSSAAKKNSPLSIRDRFLNVYQFFKGNKTPHRRAIGIV